VLLAGLRAGDGRTDDYLATRFVSHKAAQAAAHYNGLNAHSGWHKRIVDAATMRVIDKDGMVEVT
jgi:hypothetical protein